MTGPNIQRIEAYLTQRETEIMKLVAIGSRRKEMARTLKINENTIKTHLQNINARLGATNMRQALVISIQQGFIPLE